MESNALMLDVLRGLQALPPLTPLLSDILDAGFVIKDGCYFVAALMPDSTNVSLSSFPDRTGYECFINSIHVEDYDDKNPVGQAIQSIMHMFDSWRFFNSKHTLVAIISVDDLSVVVKFHVKRSAERWLGVDFSAYADPVMSIDSSEPMDASTIVGVVTGAK
ncbi:MULTISPECIES: hypothetical protein [unclassified Dyella]|uniref:hypothetical protein n=1 Tax=unclassified Dyella TaxID=2634549 RepID=UPI000CB722CA|nr:MULTISPECIES: hypothetical protein [unclassified Dyella]MDR3445808.1 hypothetical protein [Dyella sp.]PMQ04318.1 hypothetical protein DyAD56_15060 [Dyella sp. AD56]